MGWEQLMGIILAGLLIWYLVYVIKRSPGLFTMSNFSKSLTTMGILALILIAFIGFCMLLLRA